MAMHLFPLQRRIPALLVCLLCMVAGTAGASMRLTPLDEAEDIYLYAKEFGHSGITLMIPLPYTKSLMTTEEDGLLQLMVLEKDTMEDPFFVVTGITGSHAMDTPLKDWKPDDLQEVFAYLVEDQTGMRLSYTEEYGAEYPALRIDFPGYPESRHIAALRDGWLLVLSTFAGEENTDLTPMEPYEEVFAQYMLQPYNALPTVETIQLEGGMSLPLPEGMTATVDRYDEYDDDEYVLYFINAPASDSMLNQLLLTTIRNPEYAGQTLATLDNTVLNDSVSRLVLGVGELSFQWLPEVCGTQVLLLREDGYTVNQYEDSASYYLVAVKDGWLLGLTFMDHGTWPREEVLTFQMNCMTSLLGGEGKTPSQEPCVITHDTPNGKIETAFPYGFAVLGESEAEDVANHRIINLLNLSAMYSLSFDGRKARTDTVLESEKEPLLAYAQRLEESAADKAIIEEQEEGLLGEPTLVISMESGLFLREYCIKDGCLVGFGIMSDSEPLAQDDIDALPDLIRFVEK